MKIAICQLNFTVGNIDRNTQKIIKAIHEAKKNDCQLVVFSELAICGYPPYDLLFNNYFVNKSIKAVDIIASHCNGIITIVGGIDKNNSYGKSLFNTAFILSNGKVVERYYKALLPTYDIFDEARYFEPVQKPVIFQYNGYKIAVSICEDLWTSSTDVYPNAEKPRYEYDTVKIYAQYLPDLMINIAASPYSTSQQSYRYQILNSAQQQLNCPIVYVNQVGAHTDLIFDGGSSVIWKDKQIFQLPFFEEKIEYIDIAAPIEKRNNLTEIESLYQSLIFGIKDFFTKNGFKKAVLGLSGGIDSAVVAVLAAHALGNENVHCLLMPSRYSSQHSIEDALELCRINKLSYNIISIEPPFKSFENTLQNIFKDTQPDITEENIQARIRAIYLMAFANKFGFILLNTSNKSEMAVGYGTLYGDMCGALSVLGDVYKTQVYELAHFLNNAGRVIPENIIQKPPSAELRPNQKDSDSLPEYSILDKILFEFIENQKHPDDLKNEYPEELIEKVYTMLQTNDFKRYQAPPVLRVSKKSFGYGRRIPLVKMF